MAKTVRLVSPGGTTVVEVRVGSEEEWLHRAAGFTEEVAELPVEPLFVAEEEVVEEEEDG